MFRTSLDRCRDESCRAPPTVAGVRRALFASPKVEARSTPRRPPDDQHYSAKRTLHAQLAHENRLCARGPPSAAGAPVADSRRILRRLPPRVAESSPATGVMYVRITATGGPPWSEAFQPMTRRPRGHCCGAAIEFVEGGRAAEDRQVRPLAAGTEDGEEVWLTTPPSHVAAVSGGARGHPLGRRGRDAPFQHLYGDARPRRVGARRNPRTLQAGSGVSWKQGT